MRKLSIAIILVACSFSLQFCSSSKKAAAKPAPVTYEHNIMPVITSSCSPCHIAGKGNKKSLDNYTAASSSIDEIIARIQKTPGEHGFMPAMHPKLSDSTINVFVQWKNAGVLEK